MASPYGGFADLSRYVAAANQPSANPLDSLIAGVQQGVALRQLPQTIQQDALNQQIKNALAQAQLQAIPLQRQQQELAIQALKNQLDPNYQAAQDARKLAYENQRLTSAAKIASQYGKSVTTDLQDPTTGRTLRGQVHPDGTFTPFDITGIIAPSGIEQPTMLPASQLIPETTPISPNASLEDQIGASLQDLGGASLPLPGQMVKNTSVDQPRIFATAPPSATGGSRGLTANGRVDLASKAGEQGLSRDEVKDIITTPESEAAYKAGLQKRGSVARTIGVKDLSKAAAKTLDGVDKFQPTFEILKDRFQKLVDQNLVGIIPGNWAAFKNYVSGSAAHPDLKAYQDELQAFTGQLKAFTNDPGVMTDQDQKRIAQALGDITKDPRVAAEKFADIQDVIDRNGTRAADFLTGKISLDDIADEFRSRATERGNAPQYKTSTSSQNEEALKWVRDPKNAKDPRLPAIKAKLGL